MVGAIGWLRLAASPTFAVMAWLTGVSDGGMAGMPGPATHAFAWTGMAFMSLLMSVFHAGPWLKLLVRRRHRSQARAKD